MGKRLGRHSAPQEDISQTLISLAQAGHTVVRLKGGDPFVFGRGGEEIQALQRAAIPFEVVLDLTLCDDAIDYFDFSECLNDLVKTGHLTLSEEGLYAITEKGLKNSQICESSLPYSVRLRCDRNLAECNRRLRRKNQVQSSYQKRENGTYTVRFFLSDDMGSIMDLQLMATREDMARALRERFLKDPEKIYGQIMQLLLRDEEGEETAP